MKSVAGTVSITRAGPTRDATAGTRLHVPDRMVTGPGGTPRRLRGTSFDPVVLDAFLAIEDGIVRIATGFRDGQARIPAARLAIA